MKKNLSDYVVALSVIACSLVLLAALTIALSGFRLKKPTRTLQIDFEDVTGVKLHSEVRYAGALAGRVIAMRHLSRDQRESATNKRNAVRVTISVADDIPPLPADVIATLSSLKRTSSPRASGRSIRHRRWQSSLIEQANTRNDRVSASTIPRLSVNRANAVLVITILMRRRSF